MSFNLHSQQSNKFYDIVNATPMDCSPNCTFDMKDHHETAKEPEAMDTTEVWLSESSSLLLFNEKFTVFNDNNYFMEVDRPDLNQENCVEMTDVEMEERENESEMEVEGIM